MKKIILSLVLAFGIMFGGNVYAGIRYSSGIKEGQTIEERKIELQLELKEGIERYNKMSESEKMKMKNDYFLFKRGNEFKTKLLYIKTEEDKKKLLKEFEKAINMERQMFRQKRNDTNRMLSNKILKETLKVKFEKKIEIVKANLKNTKFEKLVPKFEKLVPKISDEKLLEIDKKIGKFPESIRSNKKYKDILDYLEAKIKLEIIKRELSE